MNTPPTIFHITHPKSGSQWVRQILCECAPKRIVEPKVKVAQFYEAPIIPGAIYPTIYVPRPRFDDTITPDLNLDAHDYKLSSNDPSATQNWYNFVLKKNKTRKFVVIRDMRDALVSLYFSLKVSHPLISDTVTEGRRTLKSLSFEEGFLSILRTRGKTFSNIQRSWLPAVKNGDAMMVRYEELLADEMEMFTKIIKFCELEINTSKLKKIVRKYSFENKSGRAKGIEDIQSHYRKGISGDWANHFTPKIKSEFKDLFGQLLISTGYERDLNW